MMRDGSLRGAGEKPPRSAIDGKPQVQAVTLSAAEAIATGSPRLALMGQALIWLMRFGDVALGLFHPVDKRMRRSRAVAVTHVQATGLGDVTRILSARERRDGVADPFAPGRLAPAGDRVVDLANLDHADAAAYVDGFLGPFGLSRQTTLLLRARGRVVAAVDLLGTTADDPALAGWLGFLRSSHPFLEQAYACALEFPVQFSPASDASPGDRPLTTKLTKRESAVARLVADGARNSEVAGALAIAEATVKTHLVRIYEKLGIGTRTQLAVLLRGTAPAPGDGSGGQSGSRDRR